MPNKDADKKTAQAINSDSNSLINTSIPKPPKSRELKPDPELAALQQFHYSCSDGHCQKQVGGRWPKPCDCGLDDAITAHHNALLDKILGLIGEAYDKACEDCDADQVTAQGAFVMEEALRAEVEKLKQ